MTSETEIYRTNEFLRRRKLRLQQVREQSRDIAKNIRLRAKSETLRQVVDLDAKKRKEYFERQEKLVQRLEELYVKNLNNVGSSHESASELTAQGGVSKPDISKLRGKEAAAALRQKRQAVLDEQKKLLDRKLKAREAANELSREKSLVLANKLLPKASETNILNDTGQHTTHVKNYTNEHKSVTKNDIGTQADDGTMFQDQEPTVPALSLLEIDQDNLKETEQVKNVSEKSNRLDLFAVSKEMPSDLRGREVEPPEIRDRIRPSLTLVSEHLQNRKLRLRQTEATHIVNKQPDDISGLKQTILRSRSSKPTEGSNFNICQVLDEQVVPIPSWHAVNSCDFCSHHPVPYKNSIQGKQYNTVCNSQINRIFSSIRSARQCGMEPSPVLRSTSPFRRIPKIPSKTSVCIHNSKQENMLNKISSVLMYNHSTRDTREMPPSEELVMRDVQTEEDAYAQAIRAGSPVHNKDSHKKVQDMRNKVAVTKQTVEKEYKDTVNFLNSLPKNTSTKVTKTAYMDERRQQIQNDNLQHKMQHEYRKIEKECKKHHSCLKKRHNSKSPPKVNETGDDFNIKDYQYSWMPVPESDSSLAIHTIPNGVKETKTDNTVKFSNVDSYHEYRSRHKHTPPTKDTTSNEKHSNKNRVEAVVIDNDNSADETSSTMSESSSVEDLQLNKPSKTKPSTALDHNLSDAERIIIYKILDTKSSKNCKKSVKLLNNIAKSLTSIEKVQKSVIKDGHSEQSKKLLSQRKQLVDNINDEEVILEQINEGVYKLQEDNGDMSSMYHHLESDKLDGLPQTNINKQTSKQKKLSEIQHRDKGTILQWQDGDDYQPSRTPKYRQKSTTSKDSETHADGETVIAAAMAATPFTSPAETVTNDKRISSSAESGYIKLVDKTGQETGKLLLSGTDFLKENAYEVVIQLRKKDCSQEVENEQLKDEITKQTVNAHRNIEPDVLIQKVVDSENDVQADLRDYETQKEETAFKNVLEKTNKIISPPRSEEYRQTVRTSKVQDVGCQNSPNSESSIDIRLIESREEKKDVTDKGTSIQYDLPSTEIDPPSRPATTTHTQTTDSPIHRPVYLHMSSSTSTAYMSPPEIILPQYLKRDFGMKHPECLINASKHVIRNRKHMGKTINKKNLINNDYDNRPVTPPNTARKCVKHEHDRIDQNRHKGGSSKTERTEKTCKCRYSGIEAPLKYNFKKRCHKNIGIPSELRKQSQKNVSKNNSPKSKGTRLGIKHHSMDSLNPIIKGYINKLLALNREGLKALEVAEQECSSVATPSSSVIDVPYNFNERKSYTQNNLSLEHIKKLLMQQVIENQLQKIRTNNTQINNTLIKNTGSRKSRRKVLHKVKSVNISKHLLKKRNTHEFKVNKVISPSTTTDKRVSGSIDKKSQNKSHSPQKATLHSSLSKCKEYESRKPTRQSDVNNISEGSNENVINTFNYDTNEQNTRYPLKKPTTGTNTYSESQNNYRSKTDNMSTQTCQNMDNEYMKLAEDKLNNMEKIADLTDKCTKRLSSLAKVLEEVRKNKSLVYSQITGSDSADSQSDHTSEKVVQTLLSTEIDNTSHRLLVRSPEMNQLEIPIERLPSSVKSNETNLEEKMVPLSEAEKVHPEYISFLTDIPKPCMFKLSESKVASPEISHIVAASPLRTDTSSINLPKLRPKPPPALSRMHLKHDQEHIVPHELSTVLEVDSPMSLKNKNQSSRNDIHNSSNKSIKNHVEQDRTPSKCEVMKGKNGSVNPDLIQLNRETSQQLKHSSHESSDDSKFQMIDLNHFNEIMLEPFVSIHEYAKKYNIPEQREGFNFEDNKDYVINDEISSLHSDGSLPDVIAELLKRNVITEPFKFDTASNINSTTMSSESTLSMLALSKARKSNRKSSVVFKNKENIGETSDTLSISSNPDLENALQKLGLGWASSTLKKTKERLALSSSSSNTSGSSLSQFKIKSFNQDIPALVSDSVSSVLMSKKILKNKNLSDNSKSGRQQTSFTNSMTVKEFLANELANKITFTSNKSGNNDTEEFASLFVTKMPEVLKQQSQANCDENSNNESICSGQNRARTSTPVQLFKSMTYHSSSGSNVSNGLFSNADDLSSVKMTSNSMKNHSTSDKDDLTIPGLSLKIKKGSDCSKSE